MQTEIVISGFGGQGVLFAGQILAYAAIHANKNVTWFPSYGPEMRGGTANCTVIISDEEIGSPNVRHPEAVLVMNLPSLDKYEYQVRSGGTLIINSSLVNREVKRKDIKVVKIAANEVAEELGDKRMTNMVMLGALLECVPALPIEIVKEALEAHLPAKRRNLLEANKKALDKGVELAYMDDVITIV